MRVKLIERQPTRIVCLHYVGPYGQPLAEFWGMRARPWIARRGLGGRAMYGISYDDPEVTAPEKCRYDVGVEVGDDFVPIDDEQVMTIPGGRYATTHFFDTVPHMHEAWQDMLRDWLPASGMKLDARPMFEYYPPDMKYDDATGAFECEITIPVAPL